MESDPENTSSSQPIPRWHSGALLAACLFAVGLYPTHPLKHQRSHLMEQTRRLNGHQIHRMTKIYSVLRSHGKDIEENRAWEISRVILEESQRHALDPMLVLAVIQVESRFQNSAVSPVGARGLMQIRPFVAVALAPKVGLSSLRDVESLHDPVFNIKLGVFYLSHLKQRFRDLRLALTAYNWGPTEIRNRLIRNATVPQGYASRVLATYRLYLETAAREP